MKKLFFALMIIAGTSLRADPITPSLPSSGNASTGSRSTVVNSNGVVITPGNFRDANGLSQFKYLKVVPISEFNNPSIPSFGLKFSPDGTNFTTLTTKVNFDDTGYGLFAPTITYYSNKFWVETDCGANIGASIGQSNVFGLFSSSNLVDWVKVQTVTNHSLLSTGSLFGGEFFQDRGRLYLYWTCGYPDHTYTYVTWPTNASFTKWAPAVMVADYPGHSTWDPAVIRRGDTYFMALVDTGLRAVHMLTNNISPTNTFHEFQARVSFGTSGTNYGVEACNFLQRGENDYVLYVQATTPGYIGKCYYATSTDLITWSDLAEVRENGPITDHGTTIALEPAQQVIVSQLWSKRSSQFQDEEVYDINQFTNTGTLGPARYFGGQSVANIRWDITAFAVGDQFALGEEYNVATFNIGATVFTPDPLARATNGAGLAAGISMTRVFSVSRPGIEGVPDVSWRVVPMYTNGGVALKCFSSELNQTVRWRVRERIDNVGPYLKLGETPGQSFTTFGYPSNEGIYMDDAGYIHLAAYNLKSFNGVITNGALVWFTTNAVPNFALPNGSIATTTAGKLYLRTGGAWVEK